MAALGSDSHLETRPRRSSVACLGRSRCPMASSSQLDGPQWNGLAANAGNETWNEPEKTIQLVVS